MSATEGSSYGTVDMPRETEAFLPTTATTADSRRRFGWKSAAVVASLAVAGVSYCVSIQHTLHEQDKTLQSLHEKLSQLANALDSQSLQEPLRTTQDEHAVAHSKSVPSKFVVDHATPRKTQDNRGTCWDFASVAVLEHAYRLQGVERGYLDRNEYVSLSEQAYGAEVVRLCAGTKDSTQQVDCLIPGNEIWRNSTEGGESAELYYLQNGLEGNIYPHSICPYTPDAPEAGEENTDAECRGLTREKRKTNPLRVDVKGLKTMFDEEEIKEALVRTGQAMAFTTATPYVTTFRPCVGSFASEHPEQCDPTSDACMPCPPDVSNALCCVADFSAECYNMNGEFIGRKEMHEEGGHVMTLVGFNDHVRTEQGFTGGYILKNSWWDGTHPPLGPRHARGSHSLAYWMQEVTDWEERVMCPNSASPSSWFTCGETSVVTHATGGAGVKRSENVSRELWADCLSEETRMYARTNLQPLHLKCVDERFCRRDGRFTYFARSFTDFSDQLQVFCALEYDSAEESAAEVCLPPMRLQELAYVLTPVDAELQVNDPDACGFYFYPYEVQQLYKQRFGNFYVNHFEVEWQEQSYAANKAKFPHLDYEDVIKSTRRQNEYSFDGPFPFAQVVKTDEWS